MSEIEESQSLQDAAEPLGSWWEKPGCNAPVFCSISPLTGEFMGLGQADPSPLEPGVWLMPAHSVVGDSPIVFPDCAAVWSEKDSIWNQVPDYRGRTVYDKESRAASVCEALGELAELYTLDAPQTDFDVWQGGRWVFDADARNAVLTNQARLKKTLLNQCAASIISTLQYAVDKGIATDAEVAALDAWRTYNVMLSRIEPGPSVVWPASPDNAALNSWLESKEYEDLPDLPTEAP
jgi:hypothetical protein